MRTTGRDPVDGWIYLDTPVLRDGRGPERVATEAPPDDWQPRPFIGFTMPAVESEPLLWEGDNS